MSTAACPPAGADDTRTGHDQALLQRQIDATDAQIDPLGRLTAGRLGAGRLVCDLCRLTPAEIAIVEGNRG